MFAEAVAEGVRRYLHDLDRHKKMVADFENAEKDVAAWSEDHLDWFLSEPLRRYDPWQERLRHFALKRRAASGQGSV